MSGIFEGEIYIVPLTHLEPSYQQSWSLYCASFVSLHILHLPVSLPHRCCLNCICTTCTLTPEHLATKPFTTTERKIQLIPHAYWLSLPLTYDFFTDSEAHLLSFLLLVHYDYTLAGYIRFSRTYIRMTVVRTCPNSVTALQTSFLNRLSRNFTHMFTNIFHCTSLNMGITGYM